MYHKCRSADLADVLSLIEQNEVLVKTFFLVQQLNSLVSRSVGSQDTGSLREYLQRHFKNWMLRSTLFVNMICRTCGFFCLFEMNSSFSLSQPSPSPYHFCYEMNHKQHAFSLLPILFSVTLSMQFYVYLKQRA